MWDGTAKESNYTVVEGDLGTLAVFAQSIDPSEPMPGAYQGVTVDSPSDVVYSASEQKWVPVVAGKDGSALVEGTDYSVGYFDAEGNEKTDFTNVTGPITVVITGIGNYAGTVTREYQITPAPLSLTTGSASKYYDGAPLTSEELTIEGVLGSDQVTGIATGSQTDIGQSDNTYVIVWPSEQMKKNYQVVSEQLGKLTVDTPPAPAPVPGPEPGPAPSGPTSSPTTPSGSTSTPSSDTTTGSAPADSAATASKNSSKAADGASAQSEQKQDSKDSQGLAQEPHCWVHWIMLLGAIATLIYGVAVSLRRRRMVADLDNEMNDVITGAKEGSDK